MAHSAEGWGTSSGLDPIWLGALLIACAIAGDTVNYHVGKAIGLRVMKSETSRWLNKKQLAKVANMVVAFVAVVAFTLLSRRYRRHQLTIIFSGFCAAALGAFAFTVEHAGHGSAWALYLFGDLFNTLMVATFFVFLNDSVEPQDSKRLYGPIVLGGVAGGAVGSTFLSALIQRLDNAQWMWVCAGLSLVIAGVAVAAGRIVDRRTLARGVEEPPSDAAPEVEPVRGNAALEGARLVLRSRYLLSIVAIVGLYEIVSTILDFQFTATVFGLLEGDAAKRQLATVYTLTNWVGLGIQVFATAFVMQRFGIAIALFVMPLAILGNSALYLVMPVLWIGSFLNTSDNALNYSLNQSAREALWTPTSREEKYKAKAFIDMFVQRSAKAIAVGINLLISSMFVGLAGIRWLSIFAIALIVVWLLAARYAGKHYDAIAGGDGRRARLSPS